MGGAGAVLSQGESGGAIQHGPPERRKRNAGLASAFEQSRATGGFPRPLNWRCGAFTYAGLGANVAPVCERTLRFASEMYLDRGLHRSKKNRRVDSCQRTKTRIEDRSRTLRAFGGRSAVR